MHTDCLDCQTSARLPIQLNSMLRFQLLCMSGCFHASGMGEEAYMCVWGFHTDLVTRIEINRSCTSRGSNMGCVDLESTESQI